MATVDKTWVFASDNEGLADVGDSAISVAHDSAGNPGGSLEFLGAATGTTERARRASTGETWETWGVPSGSTVTDVQVISWDRRKWALEAGRTLTLTFRIVNSSATTVHSAGELTVNATTGGEAAWTGIGAGTSRAVDGSYQASTTDVRLEAQCDLSAVSASMDCGIDNILLRITYTAGGGGTTVKQLAALGVG